MAKARIVYVVDDKRLKALDKELKGIQKENKKVEDGFKGTNEEIKKGKTNLVDLKGAVAGLGLAALAGAAIVSFAKLTQEINKNRKAVALLTKETGKSLDIITAKVRATSKVFDKDFNEILRTANTLSKEFGVSMTAALDEINEGFVRGLDINGEFTTFTTYKTEDPKKHKAIYTLKGSLSTGGTTFSVDGEVRQKDQKSYVQIRQFPSLFFFDVSALKDKWVLC